jgi:hypothetical protein
LAGLGLVVPEEEVAGRVDLAFEEELALVGAFFLDLSQSSLFSLWFTIACGMVWLAQSWDE